MAQNLIDTALSNSQDSAARAPNLIDSALAQAQPTGQAPASPPANLIDTALQPSGTSANLIDTALSAKPAPAPAPSVWDRVSRVVTESPLSKSLGEFFSTDAARAGWEAAGPELRKRPEFALRHAPITSPEAWRAMFSLGGV